MFWGEVKSDIVAAASLWMHFTLASSWYQPKLDWKGLDRGTFVYRDDTTWNLLQEIDQSIRSFGDESPYVIADIFSKTAESCMHHFELMQKTIYKRIVL